MVEPSISGYESFTLIGKGGFSRVYRAVQTTLKRQIAVKVLNFGLSDEDDRRSFERETELMGRVSTHPNIVTVHATAFTAEGRPCIIMEHYPGGSLAQMVRTHGLLQADEALEVGVSIASALSASHQAGILHCDLKPQNILVSEFGQPALGDFGISTFAEERTRTATGAGSGFTLAYAAPEIVEGESPSVVSDIYSLAATLYTLLRGQRPFSESLPGEERPTAAEQARRILLEEPPSLVDAGVAPEIDRVIRSAMAKDPARRPQSASEFAAALYETGQRLGFGTSVPRTVGGTGLRMPDAAFVDAAAIEAAPAIDFTRSRQPAEAIEDEHDLDGDAPTAVAPVPAGSTPSPSDASPSRPMQGGSNSRNVRAVAVAVLSLLVVGGVLFLVSRTNDDSPAGVATATSTPITSDATAIDPIIAPNRPTNVQIASSNDSSLIVWWTAGQGPTADVSYEVRPEGVTGSEPVITNDTFAVVSNQEVGQGVCLSVLAVRGNRTSQPSAPGCLPALELPRIEVVPADCASGTCDLDIRVDARLAGEVFDLLIVDTTGTDINTGVGTYEATRVADAPGVIESWRVRLTGAEPGRYLAVATSDGGSPVGQVFTVGNGSQDEEQE